MQHSVCQKYKARKMSSPLPELNEALANKIPIREDALLPLPGGL